MDDFHSSSSCTIYLSHLYVCIMLCIHTLRIIHRISIREGSNIGLLNIGFSLLKKIKIYTNTFLKKLFRKRNYILTYFYKKLS